MPDARSGQLNRNLIYAAELLALAAMYVIAGRLGLKLDAVAGFATLVWAPTGIALAALLIGGYRLWPGIALGAFAANALSGAPIPVAMGIAMGNTLEALAGAYALQRIPGFRCALDRLIDAFAMILIAAVLSTAISASIGVLSLYLGGLVHADGVGRTFRAWWLGDVIGDLLVAPLLLVWSAGKPRADKEQWLEAGTLGLCLVAVSLFVFGNGDGIGSRLFGDAYLFFPLFMWAALRFGQRGSVTVAFLVSVIAIWGTVAGHGPFVERELYLSLFALQTFMGVTAATFLVLGASVSERGAALDRLQSAIAGEQQMGAERDEAHQRLLAVLEQSPVAIGIVDAKTGRYLFTNGEVERILGQRPRMSSSAGKLTPPNASEWKAHRPGGEMLTTDEFPVTRAIKRGEVIRDEIFRIVRRDMEAKEVMTNAAPVRDPEGNIVAAVVIFRDVTEQRRKEDELRRAHETAAAANRAKSEFLAVMSHELRTPLNAIGGHIQLVEMGVHGPVNDAQREALQRVQRSQRHLLSLINDLLNLTRIETGRVDFEISEVPLEPLVAEAVSMIEPLLASHDLRCDIVDSPYAPDLEIRVRIDREKTQQILLNLLNNAIKFTPHGGRITVEARLCDESPGMAAVLVTDSGVGIPPAKLETIFEPFVQLANRPANPSIGLGLGLSISRDLARGMGGNLTATSDSGNGSTFTLLLPLVS
ncbi:MAG TPA: MASE1 domain-containing protein [Gemmatimonadaceae bacterium]|nr:MASE1 domain-containing protein [Gemmatimonadaceae bacterium]